MKIPKYIQELMGRSSYEFITFRNHENFSTGYTIKIAKYSAYEQIDTLRKEVERLCNWANRVAADTAHILYIPTATRHRDQYAVVTIFDPVMQKIERYIPQA